MAYILIVDDAAFTNDLLARDLRNSGHSVRALADPSEISQVIVETQVDLAIVDILFLNSPLTGVDVLEVIRTEAPGAKVIISTEGGRHRHLELTVAIERFRPEGLVLKETQSFSVAVERVLRGELFMDDKMAVYSVARGAPSPEILVAKPSYVRLWLALSNGHLKVKELAKVAHYHPKTVEQLTGEMRAHLTPFVGKATVTKGDLAAYASANDVFFRNEARRRGIS